MNISKIFDNINKFDRMGNSFSQNVYLVGNKIIKIYNDVDKGHNELYYLNYFNNYIDVPKLIESGTYKKRFYIIMEYIDGVNYNDEDVFYLKDEIYEKIGILIGKMHNIVPTKKDNWKEYMLYRVEKNYKYIKEKQLNIDIDKIYKYLKCKIDTLSYIPSCMHSDFRMGNLIISDKVYLIDLESVKSGDPVFDFVKLYRIFSKEKFNLLKKGYKTVSKLDSDFEFKLHFYNLYDAFTTIGWCIEVNRFNSDFYNFNMKFLKEEIEYIWKKEAIPAEKNMDFYSLKK